MIVLRAQAIRSGKAFMRSPSSILLPLTVESSQSPTRFAFEVFLPTKRTARRGFNMFLNVLLETPTFFSVRVRSSHVTYMRHADQINTMYDHCNGARIQANLILFVYVMIRV